MAQSSNGPVRLKDIARDLKVKYQSKGLGFLWSLLHPAIYIGIWYLVFSLRVLNIQLPDYWAFLLGGMLTYTFIQQAITEGAWAVCAFGRRARVCGGFRIAAV